MNLYTSCINSYEYTYYEYTVMHIITLKYLKTLTMEGSYMAFDSNTDGILENTTHNTCAEKDRTFSTVETSQLLQATPFPLLPVFPST